MKETSTITANDSLNQTNNILKRQKAWATPKLKILPVPDKTHGGAGKSIIEGPNYTPS